MWQLLSNHNIVCDFTLYENTILESRFPTLLRRCPAPSHPMKTKKERKGWILCFITVFGCELWLKNCRSSAFFKTVIFKSLHKVEQRNCIGNDHPVRRNQHPTPLQILGILFYFYHISPQFLFYCFPGRWLNISGDSSRCFLYVTRYLNNALKIIQLLSAMYFWRP